MLHGRIIATLIGLGLLSACSEAEDGKRNAQNDNGADLSLSVGSGGGKVSIGLGGLQGKLNLPSFKLGSSEVDISGVKLYPGAHVTSVDISGQSGQDEGGVVFKFDADAKPATIQSYYLDAFRKKGMTASADGSGVAGRDEDGKPFRIELKAQGEGTRGAIHMNQAGG